jgi:hypothetical protein
MALRIDCTFHEKDISTEPVRCVSNGTPFNWVITISTHRGLRYFTVQMSAYSCRVLWKSDKVVCSRTRAGHRAGSVTALCFVRAESRLKGSLTFYRAVY